MGETRQVSHSHLLPEWCHARAAGAVRSEEQLPYYRLSGAESVGAQVVLEAMAASSRAEGCHVYVPLGQKATQLPRLPALLQGSVEPPGPVATSPFTWTLSSGSARSRH